MVISYLHISPTTLDEWPPQWCFQIKVLWRARNHYRPLKKNRYHYKGDLVGGFVEIWYFFDYPRYTWKFPYVGTTEPNQSDTWNFPRYIYWGDDSPWNRCDFKRMHMDRIGTIQDDMIVVFLDLPKIWLVHPENCESTVFFDVCYCFLEQIREQTGW